MKGHPIFAAIYNATNAPVEKRFIAPRRARLLGELGGRILDVGAGTGANLPYYASGSRVVALEPSPAMRAKLQKKAAAATAEVAVSDGTAEALPFEDKSFDAVVFTLSLCTIPRPEAALTEARRVLKDDGKLAVLEHVRGAGRLARRQDRWAPLWSRFGGGCRPNRDTRSAVEDAGFTFGEVETFADLPRWVLTRTMMQGIAYP